MRLDPRQIDAGFLDERERRFFEHTVVPLHGDQQRKFSGLPYVTHLLAVARRVKDTQRHSPMVAAALGHDLLEDTACTTERLQQGLRDAGYPLPEATEVVELIRELTDEYTKARYPKQNRKQRKRQEVARLAKVSSRGQTIKYADLIDNGLDLLVHDRDFARVYFREMEDMLRKMNRGDFSLYMKAMHVCQEARRELSGRAPGQLVADYLDALRRADLSALLRLFTEDAVVFSPRYGKQPAADFYRALFADTAKSELRLYDYFVSASGNICAFFHYDWHLASGDRIQFDVCDVFTLDQSDRISELRIVYDSASK